MHGRLIALRDVLQRKPDIAQEKAGLLEKFGSLTFSRGVMEKMLPKEIVANLVQAMQGKGKLNVAYADTIALAMKDWAASLGVTHFSHWFQPMTGLAAEKQDAFIDWKSADTLIEKFSGKQLLRGEPDASSFPSGGLRSTFEARGYTSWDPTSPAFIWQSAGSKVLCIPSIFFSWTGEALDMKLPLLRSDQKINEAALRLLQLLDIDAGAVFSTLGCEQEYFLIDRSFALLRPDLLMAGRTLFGAPSPKSQELEDHYFSAIKERVMAFIQDFEQQAFAMGIPLKTRHSEVAPAQFEVAPVFEKAAAAIDHNLVLMELMRQVATKHNLACLFHEKPFAGINGSGKHCNWSLATDTGINLLDPTENPENSLLFLILLAAILHAVHKHAALLRASIATPGNDHRLGGNEAPPPIISVYLGESLEEMLDHFEQGKSFQTPGAKTVGFGPLPFPDFSKDNTDRNRTSPFAFTGNKFEFRAVGSSMNCSLPITVLNVIVAESIHHLVDQIEEAKGRGSLKKETVFSVLRKAFKAARPIRFSGNGYSSAWMQEAKRRKLPIVAKSLHAFSAFEEKGVAKLFQGVLSAEELKARFEIFCEHYSKVMNIEARLAVEMFRTQIFPAALQYRRDVSHHKTFHNAFSKAVIAAEAAISSLEKAREKALSLTGEKGGAAFCDDVAPKALEARECVDKLEMLMDDRLWPLPKYREMLHLL